MWCLGLGTYRIQTQDAKGHSPTLLLKIEKNLGAYGGSCLRDDFKLKVWWQLVSEVVAETVIKARNEGGASSQNDVWVKWWPEVDVASSCEMDKINIMCCLGEKQGLKLPAEATTRSDMLTASGALACVESNKVSGILNLSPPNSSLIPVANS